MGMCWLIGLAFLILLAVVSVSMIALATFIHLFKEIWNELKKKD